MIGTRRVVEVVAAEEEAVRLRVVVVFVIELQFEKSIVDAFAERAEFGAHHLGADDVDFIRAGKFTIARIGVACGFAAANHINVELGDDLLEVYGGVVGEIFRTPQPFFFAAMPDE